MKLDVDVLRYLSKDDFRMFLIALVMCLDDGFRLTYLGYDFLAFKTLVNHGVFTAISLRLHRLGRTSFRAVKSKCDYLRHRNSYNWLYLCRLVALIEFAFIEGVFAARHCVIMWTVISIIDDDEKVTMIDFPQMVFVSHQNDQMYFDRDVECIFKFFRKRFHLNFQETTDGNDGSDIDTEECSRLSFASISKTAGFL
ncbi:hypothetical protein CICLE_v10020879mg, partial [Citrus x clementina]